MYQKAYGIIETLAPLHVGASAGEETGNLNLIFRDQFTQTGIIPGSSIRGRFRADMRNKRLDYAQKNADSDVPREIEENYWYGHEAIQGREDGGTTEAKVKFEYASLVWLPVFCPGQPIVWVTCPWLLKRYQQVARINATIPPAYTASSSLQARPIGNNRKVLFFNLGFLEIEHQQDLSAFLPPNVNIPTEQLVVIDNQDMGMIHDMALYRQSRVALEAKQKKTKKGSFFDVEALPEGSVLIFPIAIKESGWQPFQEMESEKNPENDDPKDHNFHSDELYFGGLESIGFGRTQVTLAGEYFSFRKE